jgi:hypothetical protein
MHRVNGVDAIVQIKTAFVSHLEESPEVQAAEAVLVVSVQPSKWIINSGFEYCYVPSAVLSAQMQNNSNSSPILGEIRVELHLNHENFNLNLHFSFS